MEDKGQKIMKDTVLTFTANDLQYIKTIGCDHSWVLNNKRAGSCKYLVCCHSGGAKKGHAFVVGLISRIRFVCVDQHSGKDRWAIHISEYASIDIPNVWNGQHNPVRYTTLESLGIDISTLNFEKIQKTENSHVPSLSIEQAKEGIAKKFNVSPEQIEILIKG